MVAAGSSGVALSQSALDTLASSAYTSYAQRAFSTSESSPFDVTPMSSTSLHSSKRQRINDTATDQDHGTSPMDVDFAGDGTSSAMPTNSTHTMMANTAVVHSRPPTAAGAGFMNLYSYGAQEQPDATPAAGSTASEPSEEIRTSPDIDMAQHQEGQSSQLPVSPARSVSPMEIDQPAVPATSSVSHQLRDITFDDLPDDLDSEIHFGYCYINEARHAYFTVTNHSYERLRISFGEHRDFAFAPTISHLKPNGKVSVSASFLPKQPTDLRGFNVPVRVSKIRYTQEPPDADWDDRMRSVKWVADVEGAAQRKEEEAVTEPAHEVVGQAANEHNLSITAFADYPERWLKRTFSDVLTALNALWHAVYRAAPADSCDHIPESVESWGDANHLPRRLAHTPNGIPARVVKGWVFWRMVSMVLIDEHFNNESESSAERLNDLVQAQILELMGVEAQRDTVTAFVLKCQELNSVLKLRGVGVRTIFPNAGETLEGKEGKLVGLFPGFESGDVLLGPTVGMIEIDMEGILDTLPSRLRDFVTKHRARVCRRGEWLVFSQCCTSQTEYAGAHGVPIQEASRPDGTADGGDAGETKQEVATDALSFEDEVEDTGKGDVINEDGEETYGVGSNTTEEQEMEEAGEGDKMDEDAKPEEEKEERWRGEKAWLRRCAAQAGMSNPEYMRELGALLRDGCKYFLELAPPSALHFTMPQNFRIGCLLKWRWMVECGKCEGIFQSDRIMKFHAKSCGNDFDEPSPFDADDADWTNGKTEWSNLSLSEREAKRAEILKMPKRVFEDNPFQKLDRPTLREWRRFERGIKFIDPIAWKNVDNKWSDEERKCAVVLGFGYSGVLAVEHLVKRGFRVFFVVDDEEELYLKTVLRNHLQFSMEALNSTRKGLDEGRLDRGNLSDTEIERILKQEVLRGLEKSLGGMGGKWMMGPGMIWRGVNVQWEKGDGFGRRMVKCDYPYELVELRNVIDRVDLVVVTPTFSRTLGAEDFQRMKRGAHVAHVGFIDNQIDFKWLYEQPHRPLAGNIDLFDVPLGRISVTRVTEAELEEQNRYRNVTTDVVRTDVEVDGVPLQEKEVEMTVYVNRDGSVVVNREGRIVVDGNGEGMVIRVPPYRWRIPCNGCGRETWIGPRYQCEPCRAHEFLSKDYNLCPDCEMSRETHHPQHNEFNVLLHPSQLKFGREHDELDTIPLYLEHGVMCPTWWDRALFGETQRKTHSARLVDERRMRVCTQIVRRLVGDPRRTLQQRTVFELVLWWLIDRKVFLHGKVPADPMGRHWTEVQNYPLVVSSRDAREGDIPKIIWHPVIKGEKKLVWNPFRVGKETIKGLHYEQWLRQLGDGSGICSYWLEQVDDAILQECPTCPDHGRLAQHVSAVREFDGEENLGTYLPRGTDVVRKAQIEEKRREWMEAFHEGGADEIKRIRADEARQAAELKALEKKLLKGRTALEYYASGCRMR
ncbi:hypothetical protein HK097_008597 [Rhizophlyctis rosea]|uniref:ZZ-type domain-containing protein n=1 Tax=Rhizophlyctis rosea TaxID=64517 RepID=A0AAD5X3V5_9FUNG|nr:hypothetical protein HK097_008597 [Rhizophlyctis rosea]